jgi:DNA-binding transcriptional LysR family regulator
LLKLRYICHTARKPINHLTFDNDIELQIQPYLKIDDHDIIINTALQNIGFIFTKEYLIKQHIKSGKLVEVLSTYTKNQLSIYVYYRYQLYPDPKIRAFIDFFTQVE